MKSRLHLLIILLALAAAATVTRGQAKLSGSDQRFVREAAEGGMAEVALGRLALERASSDEVKKFAQRLLDDHSRANQELARLARAKGVALPQGFAEIQGEAPAARAGDQTSARQEGGETNERRTARMEGQPAAGSGGPSNPWLKGESKKAMDRLSKLSGSEFDREFTTQMLKDHAKVISAFNRQAQGGGDPELRAWAAKTLPALHEHEKMAREVAGKVGAAPPSGRQ
jgi:putative membrane protein